MVAMDARGFARCYHRGSPMATKCRQRDKNVRGLYAQFLRENPKLLNEPICNVASPAGAADDTISAATCMQWPTETENRTEKQVLV